jgi:uncharacterized membrane protein
MQQALSQNQKRIKSIDLLRGAVMIMMAIDHVRDYFLADSFLYDPLDLEKTSVALFFTRWITHFCAPVFMMLAGTSAFIMGQKKTKKELSIFLLKRGIWLVILEMTIVNFGWGFNIKLPNLLFVTIWALGISMIFLALFIYLPKKIILALGILLVAGHNLLDNIHVPGNTLQAFGWSLLHEQQFFTWHGEILLVGYPLLPWVGIMALGYCLGEFYSSSYSAEKRKKNLIAIGISAIILFIVIRFINIYGDPLPWSTQKNSFHTFLSFIKATKYPPSLLYTLMTLGPAILFLAFTEKLIHIYLIHLLAMIASQLFTPIGWQNWILNRPIWFSDSLKGAGFSLPVLYLVWIIVVIALYPLCKWYDGYKQSHKEKWWLSYL